MKSLPDALLKTNLSLPLVYQGKVRDTYELSPNELLMVATDRISAFDFSLPCGVPGKGEVVTYFSAFWFSATSHIIPNHLIRLVDHDPSFPEYIWRRSMVVRKAKRIPVECIVRGYLFGSALLEYQRSGKAGDACLPEGLVKGQKLPAPIFTPTTKEEKHDRPLKMEELTEMVGNEVALVLEEKSVELYLFAAGEARRQGITLADTKFEFGYDDNREIMLIDELLTPDSSRFWVGEGYGGESLDKQPFRDFLSSLGWEGGTPPPFIPQEVIQETSRRYQEAYQKLCGGKNGSY
jgi:phosphoribosylaminoimidazole-succinocarboxamide synthase